jgi:hypothetical protein
MDRDDKRCALPAWLSSFRLVLRFPGVNSSYFGSSWLCRGSAVHGEAISSILLTILAQAIGLQGGYMIGPTGRDVLSQFVARQTRHV